MEGLTKHFDASILMSEACVQKLKHRENFNLRYLGLVQAKGKQKVIKIYECFDGDLAGIIDLKKATQNDFEKGMQFYFDKKFKESLANFENIIAQNPKDATAKIFLQKSKLLLENGVAKNWTGVEMMMM